MQETLNKSLPLCGLQTQPTRSSSSQVFPTPVTLPQLCTRMHTHTPQTHPYTYIHCTPAHNSSSFLHAGHWNIFLAQTPELKVTASPDKMTKTL